MLGSLFCFNWDVFVWFVLWFCEILGVASKHIILINIHYLVVILLIQSCSQNVVTFPQSLWQIRYCLLFCCWHKSTWNLKLVLHCVVYHYEVDGMLLVLTYACYWQVLSKIISLLHCYSTSCTDAECLLLC